MQTKDKGQRTDDKFALLIATRNAGKVREIERLLGDTPVALRSLKDFPDVAEPEETGADFAENAALKAKYYALQTGLPALADDSGLEVEALGGAPGVFSARYGGVDSSDAERTRKLLGEIREIPLENRGARFVCAMALADCKGEIRYLTEGVCAGRIAFEPRGLNGFGYDPVFVPEGFEKTFGELSAEIKQRISHRARATAKIIRYLRGFIAA
jgi:XTP/dITP diphosphohydrolase